jgi:hypothetical protein
MVTCATVGAHEQGVNLSKKPGYLNDYWWGYMILREAERSNIRGAYLFKKPGYPYRGWGYMTQCGGGGTGTTLIIYHNSKWGLI